MKKTSPELEDDDMLPSYSFDYRKAKPNRFAAASRQAKNIRIISSEGSSEKPRIIPIFGNKLYQQRARGAFPILVRQAKSETPIAYSDLAAELGMNPRNLNHVLGVIGQTIEALSGSLGSIPPIQLLAVQKNKGIPEREHNEIFSYERWEEILDLLGLKMLPAQTKESLRPCAGARSREGSRAHPGPGRDAHHRIAKHRE